MYLTVLYLWYRSLLVLPVGLCIIRSLYRSEVIYKFRTLKKLHPQPIWQIYIGISITFAAIFVAFIVAFYLVEEPPTPDCMLFEIKATVPPNSSSVVLIGDSLFFSCRGQIRR